MQLEIVLMIFFYVLLINRGVLFFICVVPKDWFLHMLRCFSTLPWSWPDYRFGKFIYLYSCMIFIMAYLSCSFCSYSYWWCDRRNMSNGFLLPQWNQLPNTMSTRNVWESNLPTKWRGMYALPSRIILCRSKLDRAIWKLQCWLFLPKGINNTFCTSLCSRYALFFS